MTTSTIKQFEVGKTYWARSICNHDCIYRFTIKARTEKSVTVDVNGKTARRGVKVCTYSNAETFKPFGNYSMAAVIGADKVEA